MSANVAGIHEKSSERIKGRLIYETIIVSTPVVLGPKLIFAVHSLAAPSGSGQTSLATAGKIIKKPCTKIKFGPSTHFRLCFRELPVLHDATISAYFSIMEGHSRGAGQFGGILVR